MPAEYAQLIGQIRAATAPLADPAAALPSAPRRPAEVTVSMPACNAGAFIREAIASVLRQEGIALELIVVDDGSTDDTADVVRSIPDPRVTLLRNTRRLGIGASHNAALEHSSAPYIAHVDADDFLLPGALAKGVRALAGAPRAGQSYAYAYEVDEQGWLSAGEFVGQRQRVRRHLGLLSDYRRSLIVHGMVVNPLRIYRRDVIKIVGPFDERRRYGIDYEMALRIADRFDVVSVPGFLYCQRVHSGNTQQNLRCRALRFWWDRMRTCRALLKRPGGTLLGRSALGVYCLLALGLLDALTPRMARG